MVPKNTTCTDASAIWEVLNLTQENANCQDHMFVRLWLILVADLSSSKTSETRHMQKLQVTKSTGGSWHLLRVGRSEPCHVRTIQIVTQCLQDLSIPRRLASQACAYDVEGACTLPPISVEDLLRSSQGIKLSHLLRQMRAWVFFAPPLLQEHGAFDGAGPHQGSPLRNPSRPPVHETKGSLQERDGILATRRPPTFKKRKCTAALYLPFVLEFAQHSLNLLAACLSHEFLRCRGIESLLVVVGIKPCLWGCGPEGFFDCLSNGPSFQTCAWILLQLL